MVYFSSVKIQRTLRRGKTRNSWPDVCERQSPGPHGRWADFQIKWIFMMDIDRDEEIIEGVHVENHSVTLRRGYSLIEKTTLNTSICLFGTMVLLQKPEIQKFVKRSPEGAPPTK